MVKYFLDTYALIEIINGNNNYIPYLDEDISTSIFNLYELYYNLLKYNSEKEARHYFSQFQKILIKFTDEDIFKASKFKLENKKFNISYTDALGYSISINNNMLFLTGDKEFRNKANVEFVKQNRQS